MALDNIPGKKIFNQRDVRETPAATATATAVGLTGEPYLLAAAGSADLTAERVFTAGEGLDFDDAGAGSTLTINGEDSSGTNKGIVIITAGEGVDVNYSSGTATISGEDATTTNKGVANFSGSHFTLTGGEVSLKNKTSYWSCPGCNFIMNIPSADSCDYEMNVGRLDINGVPTGESIAQAPVFLPHGAVVTACIVYGSDTAEEWSLFRKALDGVADIMATANIDSSDTSISNATIDNQNYCYFLEAGVGNGDQIGGARITYTTDYD